MQAARKNPPKEIKEQRRKERAKISPQPPPERKTPQSPLTRKRTASQQRALTKRQPSNKSPADHEITYNFCKL